MPKLKILLLFPLDALLDRAGESLKGISENGKLVGPSSLKFMCETFEEIGAWANVTEGLVVKLILVVVGCWYWFVCKIFVGDGLLLKLEQFKKLNQILNKKSSFL